MESFVQLQSDTKSKLIRAFSNFKKSPKERLTEAYIQTRLDNLEEQWKLFIKTHQTIIKSEPSDASRKTYVSNEIYETTEDTYLDYKTELKVALGKFSRIVATENFKGESSCKSVIKLPKICIPTFSGQYSEWTTFRDLFVSLIHNNDSLDKVQKLHYLKGYLTGEAEQLLRQIPVSADNYDRSWDVLNERYNNKKYLCHCIIKRLLSQRNIVLENASCLKELIDTTSECLDALTNLGINVSTWDILVIHILALKLDSESKKQWELFVSEHVSTDNLPTFEQFKKFITNRYRALEFLEPNRYSKSANQSSKIRAMPVTNLHCVYCGNEHKLNVCNGFLKQSVDDRREFVLQKRLCFNCMGSEHSARECKVSTRCKICGRLHHTLLHPKGPVAVKNSLVTQTNEDWELRSSADVAGTSAEAVPEASGSREDLNLTSCFSANKVSSQVLLATALVKVRARNGTQQLVRALIDQGSQASFITEFTVQFLGLKKTPTRGFISGLGGDKNVTTKSTVILNLQSRVDPEIKIKVKAYVLSSITAFLPAKKVVALNGLDLSGLTLADPEYHSPSKVDLLLGADIYGQIIQAGIRKDSKGGAVAQATSLGWVISGTITDAPQESTGVVVMHSLMEEEELLKKFWELEAEPKIQGNDLMTEEELKCEKIYRETTTRDEEGRYIVKIPFKVDKPHVEGSFEIAQKRFNLLENRLNKNEKFRSKFTEVMDDYLLSGHMELVEKEEIKNPNAIYVPILAVIREDKDTTQVRVVCDNSCKGKDGISINDLMMKGPVLQQDLRHLLMRWRNHVCCLVADIAKMYRQIKVTKLDTDYQRLLWRPDPTSGVQIYKMLRVSFGSASAPYLAVRTLQQVAHDEGEHYPMAKDRVLKDFYMDDLMTGGETIEETVKIYKEINEMLSKGGFTLRKWTSNKDELLKEIEKGQGTGETRLHENSEHGTLKIKLDEVMKILGLTWDRRADEFRYSVHVTQRKGTVTKRIILAEVSRLFDPLGWVSPCIIIAKTIIQKLWLKGLGWDEQVPADICKQWDTYRNELLLLKDVAIPRWLGTTRHCHMELHGFSDASNIAYAAVVYARIIDKDGTVKINLVTAKTKVAPIKVVSVPRLELCGAVLLAKLLREVADVLVIEKQYLYAWTDSTVVLAWLNGHPRRWKPFVGNRVSEILTILEPAHWAHIQSKENPADIASRGMYPSEMLKCELWKNGPDLLKSKIIAKGRHQNIVDTNMEEIRTHIVTEKEKIFERFSTLNKMIRVIAYCRRFISLAKLNQGERKIEPYLSSRELMEALNILIKKCQEEHFEDEIKDLKAKREVQKNSHISSLNPFLDRDNILRAGGRLGQSTLSLNTMHPIILPKNSHLSKLIVGDAHKQTLHGGQQLVLNYLRNKYWIIGAKLLISGVIHKCVSCIRHSTITRNQLMGQLPSARVSPARAFQNSGVDFAGPLNIRTSKGRGHHAYKGYICLFICMATRAVHLEAVSDVTAQGFLAAFRRFVSRRGHCSQIWSDNGTNFIGASKELHKMFAHESSEISLEIREILANNNTTWHFIPPYSPNFGGLWEAGIKSTKFHLKRVIGDSTLTYEELSTVLAQIEACLNSRPLSRIDSDGDTYTVLTPGHFIIGEPLLTVPDQSYESSTLTSLKRWQITQRMLQSFWNRWSREYLNQFMQRYKWARQIPEPRIGDVVLVKEIDLPPARWLFGRIVEKHPGVDGITRVVTLQAKNKRIKRPVSKLCILPIVD